MRFIETVFQKLKRHPKRIVFPEGTEPRVLRAAARFVKLQLGAPVVLGRKEEIEKVALEGNISLDHIGVIDPTTSSELPAFVSRLEKLKRYRDLGSKQAAEILSNPNYFGAMMVQYGQVDGLVTGASERNIDRASCCHDTAVLPSATRRATVSISSCVKPLPRGMSPSSRRQRF